jgi:uncharacterized protein (DUF433 family)
MENLLKRISINTDSTGGNPCIRGTRVAVALILEYIERGMTSKEILEDFPELTEDDISAAIRYGVEFSRDRCFEIPVENA